MANYLALGHQQADKTFFNEIKRVMPFVSYFTKMIRENWHTADILLAIANLPL